MERDISKAVRNRKRPVVESAANIRISEEYFYFSKPSLIAIVLNYIRRIQISLPPAVRLGLGLKSVNVSAFSRKPSKIPNISSSTDI